MDGIWNSRVGRVLAAGLVVALAAVALAVLIPDHPTADLGGTAWTLVAYGPSGAPLVAEVPARITFEANGRFDGFTGCNRFFGNYRAVDGRLEFVDDEVAMTLADCSAETPEGKQNAFFRTHLRSGIPYSQTPDRLTLHFADGQMADYVPAP